MKTGETKGMQLGKEHECKIFTTIMHFIALSIIVLFIVNQPPFVFALKKGECLPGARPARYFSINYPDFSPRFTLSWRSPPRVDHVALHTFPTKHVA